MQLVSDSSILNLLYTHRYIFAFLGALFEGTFIMLLAGILYKFGYFNFWGLFTVLVAGYFLNGIFWYALGCFGGHKILEKFSKHSRFARKIVGKLEDYFKDHSTKTLFITRVTYGISMFSFMIAGSLKMNFKKFASIGLIAAIVWVIVLGGLGFVFGVSYKAMGIINKSINIGLTIIIIIGLALVSSLILYWLRRIVQMKFIQDLEEHDSHWVRKIGVTINRLFNHKK